MIGILAVVVLVGGYLLIGQGNKTTVQPTATATPTTTTTETTATPSASPTAKMEESKVTVTKNGFEPQTLKAKIETKVTFVNNSGDTISVNSDPHPAHTLFPFLNIGIINDGASASVTVDKTGTFTYHNHLNPSQKGTIIAE